MCALCLNLYFFVLKREFVDFISHVLSKQHKQSFIVLSGKTLFIFFCLIGTSDSTDYTYRTKAVIQHLLEKSFK